MDRHHSLTSPPATAARHWLWLGAGALALVVLVIAALLSREQQRPVPRIAARSAPRLRASAPPTPVERAPVAPRVRPVEKKQAPSALSAEPSPSEPAADELEHPHPITPEHERIFKENNLVASLNDAMDRGDVERLRRLNERYRDEYPDDGHVLQEGYSLIADCLEHRTEEVEAAARRYWRDHRASSLRRYVRRHCFSERW